MRPLYPASIGMAPGNYAITERTISEAAIE